jgi:hypothetical protein
MAHTVIELDLDRGNYRFRNNETSEFNNHGRTSNSNLNAEPVARNPAR